MHALEARLRAGLRAAMKARDPIALSAIRSALGAIDNAGAVEGELGSAAGGSRHVAGGVEGLGAAEVARREMDDTQIADIVRAEVMDREGAAEDCDGLGRAREADRLRAESAVLRRLLP